MRILFRISISLALLVGCGGESDIEVDSDPPSREIEPGVWTFDGPDVDSPTDLEPLWPLLGDAKYIGLGESVHTSGGFYAIKRRLIRELVERGVRVFAMETPRTAATRLEDWLQEGSCTNVEGALSYIFPVFADTNTASLFNWLCAWNQQHPSDRVHFVGFDVQQSDDDMAFFHDFLVSFAPADVADLESAIAACKTFDTIGIEVDRGLYFWRYPAEDYAACVDGLLTVETYREQQSDALLAVAGEEQLELFRISIIGISSEQELLYWAPNENLELPERDQAMVDLDLWVELFNRGSESRDAAMAEVLTSLTQLYFADAAQIAVWAHNTHLAMNHDNTHSPNYPEPLYGVTMGTILGRTIGDEYAPVAIAAYNPGINWPGIGSGPSGYYNEPSSFEAQAHALVEPYLIVDPGSSWLPKSPMLLGGEEVLLAETYRAIVYLDESPPMESLYW